MASAVARPRPRALMASDLHKYHTKGKRPPMVASAPASCYVCSWLRLPRPAHVVDAHAPGVEVDAHAHDVEAQALWQGAVGRERTANAERRPVRDDVVVDQRLKVVERHLEALHGHGQHCDGNGEVALAAGEYVLEGSLLEMREADVRQGLAGELRAVAGVVPRDGRRCLPALGDGGGRDDGCGLAHGVPPSGS